MKKIIKLLCFFAAFSLLSTANSFNSTSTDSSTSTVIKIGIIKDIDEDIDEAILNHIKQPLKEKYDIQLEIVYYDSIHKANDAIFDNEIDVNFVQTSAYLSSYIKEYNRNFLSIGKIYTYPMGLYSKKYETLSTIPEDATVVFLESDNEDTTFLGRNILFLQQAKLLTLREHLNSYTITIFDINHNDRKVILKNSLSKDDLLSSFSKNLADLYIIPMFMVKNSNEFLLLIENNDDFFAKILVTNLLHEKNDNLQKIYKEMKSYFTFQYIKENYDNKIIPYLGN